MEKYYTPEVEEFHVGFEYEAKRYQDFWKQYFYTLLDEFPFIQMELDPSYIRVKYLDEADIESLGFEETSTRQYIIDACGDLPYWIHAVIDFRWKDDISIIGKRGQEVEILFRGKIKNKSELKKLLKQLCITK